MKLLEFRSFCSFLFDALFDLHCLVIELLEDGAVLAINCFFATRTVHEIKGYPRGHPLFL